ncbi:DUF7222 domain-containing protein [Porphyromonas somerae]|uniref:DUF7222 domain-containing protein n=1 Tax=Porphyromonas somerae TaxID=322095 RepID=UPI001FCCB9AD|nr:hypothetical protein [Porphyromonas somerae]BDE81993.1 hypothetical protein CE91St14_10210 [Porphyromonas somerae]
MFNVLDDVFIMSLEDYTDYRTLTYKEQSNDKGGIDVFCDDAVTGQVERRFSYDRNGRLDGFYEQWDKEGKIQLQTKYQNGLEVGPRVSKLKGIAPDIWEHTSIGENGALGESVYSSRAFSAEASYVIPKEEVQTILEARTKEFDDKKLAFDPEEFISNLVWETLDDLMEGCGVNDFSFSDELKEIFQTHIVDYDQGAGFFDDLARGCASGILGEFIYYSQTKDFYLRHMDDIEDYINDLGQQFGEPLSLGDPRSNYAVWAVVDDIAYRVGDDFQRAFEEKVYDNVQELNLEDAKALMEYSSMEEVTEIVKGYVNDLEEDLREEQEQNQEMSMGQASTGEEPKKINLPPPSDKKKGRSI